MLFSQSLASILLLATLGASALKVESGHSHHDHDVAKRIAEASEEIAEPLEEREISDELENLEERDDDDDDVHSYVHARHGNITRRGSSHISSLGWKGDKNKLHLFRRKGQPQLYVFGP